MEELKLEVKKLERRETKGTSCGVDWGVGDTCAGLMEATAACVEAPVSYFEALMGCIPAELPGVCTPC